MKGYAEEPFLIGNPSDAELTDRLLAPVWSGTSRGWWLLFLAASGGVGLLFFCIFWTVTRGIGVWGTNIPVGWAFAIVNFVWWIGIGHAGTFISAILLLLEQRWRTSINRLAEAMTLFAVMQAGLFPVLHLGRPWFAYWLFPYPDTMQVWPQLRSALPWDAAAITTYFTVSAIFWYVGLIPDLAALRDRAPRRSLRIIYGIFALGWRGQGKHWQHYRIAYWLLAGLATPLVVSVHSVVSLDFSSSIIPGWHTTIFPPFFVAGAIFSGFAMVLTLLIPTRAVFRLHNVITPRHLDAMAKVVIVTGSIVTYGYAMEYFMAYYGQGQAEIHQMFKTRPLGPGHTVFWIMLVCNVLAWQPFWWKSVRRNIWALFVISLLVNLGMWAERFVIVVQSLEQDYLPAAWAGYRPTWVDLGLLTGTICFFCWLYLLFIRFVPAIPVMEIKEMRHDQEVEEKEHARELGPR